MYKTRIDISLENFDNYFWAHVPGMSPLAKEGLPRDIHFNLFHARKSKKIGFMEYLYVLTAALGKRWVLMVMDEYNGMTAEDFDKFLKITKKKDSVAGAEALIEKGEFVLAGKELFDAAAAMNTFSISPAYTYLSKVKNLPKNKVTESEKEIGHLLKFLQNYEINKKKWATNHQFITVPEWYVLIALFAGNEVNSRSLYRDIYRQTFQCSINKITKAFTTLHSRGMVEKIGSTRGLRLKITPSGKEMARSLLTKYMIPQ